MGLFAVTTSRGKEEDELYSYEPIAEWSDREKLEREKEVLGLYLSAKPLDAYRRQIVWLEALSFAKAATQAGAVVCCGTVKNKKIISTKKGDRMAFVELEDSSGFAEIIVFPKVFQRVSELLESQSIFVVRGIAETQNGAGCKIKADELLSLETLFSDWSMINGISFTVLPDKLDLLHAAKLQFVPGKTPFSFIFIEKGKTLRLVPRERFMTNLETLKTLHDGGIQIKVTLQPPPRTSWNKQSPFQN